MSKNQKTRKKTRLSTNTSSTTTTTTLTSSTTTLTTSDLSSSNRFSYVDSSCSSSTILIKQARKQLIKAIIHEDIDLIKSLLSQYDLINIRDKHKNTILHIACGFGRLKSIELILSINSNLLNEKDEKGHTAIDVAIKHGQFEVIEWLINKNILENFDSIDTSNHRRSYLHFCCKYGDNRILRLICSKMSESQITLDQLDSYGNTAAHLAAKYNHLDCLQTLVEFNCDISIKNKHGQTACFIADLFGNQECVNYLMIVETCINLSIKLVKLNRQYRETKQNNEVLKAQMDEAIAINNDFINQRENSFNLTLELMEKKLNELEERIRNEINEVKLNIINNELRQQLKETNETCNEILKLDKRKLDNLKAKFNNFKCYLEAISNIDEYEEDYYDKESKEYLELLRKMLQESTHKLFIYRTVLKENQKELIKGTILSPKGRHQKFNLNIPRIKKHRAEIVYWKDDEDEFIESDKTLIALEKNDE